MGTWLMRLRHQEALVQQEIRRLARSGDRLTRDGTQRSDPDPDAEPPSAIRADQTLRDQSDRN